MVIYPIMQLKYKNIENQNETNKLIQKNNNYT